MLRPAVPEPPERRRAPLPSALWSRATEPAARGSRLAGVPAAPRRPPFRKRRAGPARSAARPPQLVPSHSRSPPPPRAAALSHRGRCLPVAGRPPLHRGAPPPTASRPRSAACRRGARLGRRPFRGGGGAGAAVPGPSPGPFSSEGRRDAGNRQAGNGPPQGVPTARGCPGREVPLRAAPMLLPIRERGGERRPGWSRFEAAARELKPNAVPRVPLLPGTFTPSKSCPGLGAPESCALSSCIAPPPLPCHRDRESQRGNAL